MFIEVDSGVINIDNVSNIGFLSAKNRIIFNFNCSIESDKMGVKRLISDYRYWNFETVEAFNKASTKLQQDLVSIGVWIQPELEEHHWVNSFYVTYINVDTRKNRLIFNLSNSITKDTKLGKNTVVNDFVFWDFGNDRYLFEQTKNEVTQEVLENY